MKKFLVDGFSLYADDLIDGILVEPRLPMGFMAEEHQHRHAEELEFWWHRPFILVDRGLTPAHIPISDEDAEIVLKKFKESWPTGMRHDLYVMDGAVPASPTLRGCFENLGDAITSARAWLVARSYQF